jgi:hypothetical protein
VGVPGAAKAAVHAAHVAPGHHAHLPSHHTPALNNRKERFKSSTTITLARPQQPSSSAREGGRRDPGTGQPWEGRGAAATVMRRSRMRATSLWPLRVASATADSPDGLTACS